MDQYIYYQEHHFQYGTRPFKDLLATFERMQRVFLEYVDLVDAYDLTRHLILRQLKFALTCCAAM